MDSGGVTIIGSTVVLFAAKDGAGVSLKPASSSEGGIKLDVTLPPDGFDLEFYYTYRAGVTNASINVVLSSSNWGTLSSRTSVEVISTGDIFLFINGSMLKSVKVVAANGVRKRYTFRVSETSLTVFIDGVVVLTHSYAASSSVSGLAFSAWTSSVGSEFLIEDLTVSKVG